MSAMFSPSVCFPFTCRKEEEETAWGPLVSHRCGYPELLIRLP